MNAFLPRRRRVGGLLLLAAVPALAMCAAPEAHAQRPVKQRETKAEGGGYAAFQMLRKGQELLDAGEHDRGKKLLETLVEQYPSDPIRFKAYLALGKHSLDRSEQLEAIGFLRNLRTLEQAGTEMDDETRDLFLESLYLQGVALFQTRQYAAAFPLLRKITNDYPNTVWANQSYYFIGMCHFAQGNWNKAIEALGLVGTFVDPKSPALEFAEAGRRFYVKINDADLPVLERIGADVKVTVTSASGDSESAALVPLPGDDRASIGSVATALGKAIPGDGVLQIIGGDRIRTAYVDGNTREGKKDVPRDREVQVVSTASLSFTRGDHESKAEAAFLGQPVFLLLSDADLDVSPREDGGTVRVASRYKVQEEEGDGGRAGVDVEKILRTTEETWRTRDEITVTLRELRAAVAKDAAGSGGKPAAAVAEDVHTGRFGGEFQLVACSGDRPVDQADGVLAAAIGDELVATFVDELHIGGTSPRTVTATTVVASEIENKPRATQYEVADKVVAARKNLVEATALLELGRIYKAMGLMKGAVAQVQEGLTRVEPIIRQSAEIPGQIAADAFRMKWELQTVADDFEGAIRTCELFNKLYPESPFVDRALLEIGRMKEESEKPQEAIRVYRRVLGLANSQVKAEAQFRIAKATEKIEGKGSEQAINQYKICAEQYPESQFAGESLGKLIDYHVEQKDYTAASDLLRQVFQDYPDAQFLDSMMLKYVIVDYRMGNFQAAHDRCTKLIFEYPASQAAAKAKEIMPTLEKRLKPAGEAAPAADAGRN